MKSLSSIGDVLGAKDQKSSLMKGIKASMVVEEANKMMSDLWGESVATQAQAISFKNKCVSVACLNGAIANEIKLYQNTVLQAVNKKFGAGTADTLKIML